MEREKDEVVQRKAQLGRCGLYHAAADHAARTKSSPSSRRTRPLRRRSQDAENEEVAEQRKLQALKERCSRPVRNCSTPQIEASTIAESLEAVARKNLRHKIKALDKESVKQAELIYNAERDPIDGAKLVVKGERSEPRRSPDGADREARRS